MPDWSAGGDIIGEMGMRKSMGKKIPFTDLAAKRTIHELEKLEAQGHPNGEVLWQSVMMGYRGVFPLKNRPTQQRSTPQQSFKQQDEQRAAERVREMTGGIISPRPQVEIFEMEVVDGLKRIGPAH